MIAIPAVDLREGACVQLVGGALDEERVRLDDPVAVARGWGAAGFTRLHVVDLDAAFGQGTNADVIAEILREVPLEIQVGGGVRSAERIEQLMAAGADRVIVGTRALEDPWWFEEMASRYPQQLIVACDVRERRVVTRGWTETTSRLVLDVIEELAALPIAGFLVTAVHKEGRMGGTDLPLMQDVAEAAAVPVLASGGIGTVADLHALEDRGVAGVVLGMALYTGALDPRAIAEEFHA
ncbi:MAG: 1-(5-phosphoribosyl)-5-[(5-phosphoribosylamino)methylideneamino]imidazole-4-carboxamide isomerase [Gemmatimonadetes bacterium]|nr:1-(5-phosphoribosyl)-5-[(5-phosphoribosylamino)methylideneamino]imidazole-4-carboxamide isomerase [Gemmatimonadota bacterium]